MPANTEMAHCVTSLPKSEIPPDVARNTRSVLLSSMKGVLLKRFCRDYKSLVGEEFPWRKLGFRSSTSLLQAMTDVARFEFSKKDGDYKVYGIADGMVYTPSWFVKAQGDDNYLLDSLSRTLAAPASLLAVWWFESLENLFWLSRCRLMCFLQLLVVKESSV